MSKTDLHNLLRTVNSRDASVSERAVLLFTEFDEEGGGGGGVRAGSG